MKYKNLLLLVILSLSLYVSGQNKKEHLAEENKAMHFDPKEEENRVYYRVDTQATYPGGHKELVNFINSQIQLPKLTGEKTRERRVIVEFIVEKDGSLSGFYTRKNEVREYGEEVMRILKMTEGWKPAQVNGIPVRYRYTFIYF